MLWPGSFLTALAERAPLQSFVQVLPLQIGELGRKQFAISLDVLPMAPHLGSFKVNHPPSPLWMTSVVLLIRMEEFAPAPSNERSRTDVELRLASAF